LLRSAIENVVRNAVRHTAQGTEVSIGLRCEDVNGDRHALVSVRDHGKGCRKRLWKTSSALFIEWNTHAIERREVPDWPRNRGSRRAVTWRTIKAANAPDGGLMVEIRLPN